MVLRREAFDNFSKYVRLVAGQDDKFTIGVSSELMTILGKPLMDRGDGTLPFRLNFLND